MKRLSDRGQIVKFSIKPMKTFILYCRDRKNITGKRNKRNLVAYDLHKRLIVKLFYGVNP